MERPAAVGVDGLVDIGHKAEGFFESDDHFLVMGEVVVGEGAAAAVFEPFFADLVAADMEAEDFGRDAFEILVGVDVKAIRVGEVFGVGFFDPVSARNGVTGYEV